jgi:hypothetical protein
MAETSIKTRLVLRYYLEGELEFKWWHIGSELWR